MRTTVSLNGIKMRAFHGFYPEEREKGNDFILNICVELKSFDRADDNINDTVNYEEVYKICEAEMKQTKKLLESVVFAIITRLKNELEHVTSGKVSLKKLNPPLKGDIAEAEVCMEF